MLRCDKCQGVRGMLIGGCTCVEPITGAWVAKEYPEFPVDQAIGRDESVVVNSHGTRVAPDGSVSETELLRELGHHE